MNTQNMNEILDALALRFGATGEALWGVLVQQQIWEGVLFYAFLLSAFLVSPGLVRASQEEFAPGSSYLEREAVRTRVTLAAVLFLLLWVVVLVTGFSGGFLHLLNPEFYALQALLPQ